MLPLADVRGRELPVAVGLLDAVQEPLLLLVPGHVEEQLDDPRAVVREVPLPVVDLAVPAGPDVLAGGPLGQPLAGEELRVDADDQDLLVVAAVEDADHAPGGQPDRGPPQEVVVQLVDGGGLEAGHLHALRVDAAHHVADGAVLARGVDGLEHDQQAVHVLGRQPLLVLREQLHALLEGGLRLLLAHELGRVPGVEVGVEADLAAGLDPQRVDQAPDLRGSVVGHRAVSSAAVTRTSCARRGGRGRARSRPGCTRAGSGTAEDPSVLRGLRTVRRVAGAGAGRPAGGAAARPASCPR